MPAAASDETTRLLVVDDDPLLRRALARTLGRAFDVSCVDSAAAALALLERGTKFDAVLCDLNLAGGISGTALYARMVAIDRRLAGRVIFMSGASPPPIDAHWLQKPFETSQAIALVRSVTSAYGRTA